MTNPPTSRPTRTKRGRWAAYNARRVANRELDRQRRRANRQRRQAEAAARLLAEVAISPPTPLPPVPPAPPLTLRLTVEIAGEKHRFTLRWCPLFRRWSMPKGRLFEGLAALLARAPEIVAGR